MDKEILHEGERIIISDHINSLCLNDENLLELGIDWKNWFDIYRDYKNDIIKMQPYNRYSLTHEGMPLYGMSVSLFPDRFHKHGNYHGVYFPIWYRYIKSLNYVLNIGNNFNFSVQIEGNQLYKVC